MNNQPNNINEATSWSQIDQFKIRHVHQAEPDGSVKLFNNGRQQLTFEIDIRALDANGREVILNNEALSRIRLIDYNTGAEVPHGNDFTGDWYTSFSHRGYQWSREIFSYIGLSATDEHEDNIYKIRDEVYTPKELAATGVTLQNEPVTLRPGDSDFPFPDDLKMSPVTRIYLSCASGIGKNKKLAVKITSPDGRITVVSNNTDAPEGDPSGDGNGKFNSSVTVIPVQLKNLDISCYGDLVERKGEWVLHRVGVAGYVFGIYESHLFCKPGSNLNIDFNLVLNYPGWHTYFSLYNELGEANDFEAMTSYVGQPGESVVRSNWPAYYENELTGNTPTDTLIFLKDEKKIHLVENGKVVLGACCTPVHGWFRDQINGPTRRNLQENLYLYDIYGNSHPVGIKIDQTGVTYIVPYKW